jgi:peptide/nickel transport system substrate-binding protein
MKFALALAVVLAWAPQADAAAAQKGDCGTIVLPTGGGDGPSDDITSFSPIFSDSAYNEESGWLLYPNLLWINRFSQIDWSRSLASAVTASADDTVFTITMRPWHWSDGVPLTAEDVLYSFNLDKQYGPNWPGYGTGGLPMIVKSITVLSPAQLQIVTTHPVNPMWFTYNGIGALEPLPEHAWKTYTLDEMLQLQSTPSFFSVVDGPLKIQRLDVGQDAVFVPNPAWEGPKMHFSRLVFTFLQGDGANVQGVESGAFDVAAVPTDLYSSVQHFPGVHLEIMPQSVNQNVIAVNFQNPAVAFFRDVRVRQAMQDAIDQDAIVRGLDKGYGDAAYGPIPHSFVQFLTPEMRAGKYPVGYDPAKARALLKAAGFTPGPDGIMRKNGQRLSFTYLEETGTDAIIELDEILQADFRAVGIEMKVHLTEFNQIMALMNGPPTGWQATGFGQPVQSYPSGEGQFATGANQNQEGYSDPEMDRLIAENTEKPDIKYLFAYETYASAQQPVIFTPRLRPVVLVRDRLHGMSDFLDPVGMFAPDQLYCTAEGEAHG